MAKASVIYRIGSATDDALTPRPGKDTTETAGKKPGLSVYESGPKRGCKAQKIDPGLLLAGLAYVPDDPSSGGETGHGVIAPLGTAGDVEQTLLDEWADYRGTGRRHRFTQAVLDSIIERDVRSES